MELLAAADVLAIELIPAVDLEPPDCMQAMPPRSLEPLELHAWLMYVSTGFLLPFGILVARFMRIARKESLRSSKALQILYYFHLALQTTGVAVLTGGAVYSFKTWGFNLSHTHQKLGFSLWIIMWAQPVIGFLRPNHGAKGRPIWYGIHWVLGTGSMILCFVNLYIGMHIWEHVTKGSIRNLNIAFSIQVAFMAFVYLVQDRWDYMVEQGHGLSKPIAPPPSTTLTPISYSMVPSSMEYQMRHYFPA
ncbi:hypothetical protein L7F22_013700 [Adiantum nelumboides]|nr:hypothetical protein [Adiantum nelumboides]